MLATRWLYWWLVFHFFYAFFGPSINKNEPVTESPSCLFSPPSESALASQLALSASCDQRAPCSLAGVVSHDPGMASRQVAPPFGSRACCFLSAFSPTLTKSAAATSTAHPIPGQSAQLFIYQMSSQQLQQQPSANKKAGKIHNTPSANQLNTTQHLAKPFQQILLGSQSGSLTSPFLACWNQKLVSFSCLYSLLLVKIRSKRLISNYFSQSKAGCA